jgi:hypothetical protein
MLLTRTRTRLCVLCLPKTNEITSGVTVFGVRGETLSRVIESEQNQHRVLYLILQLWMVDARAGDERSD